MEIAAIGHSDPRIRDFVGIPYRLYRNDPQWVPVPVDKALTPFMGTNPFFAYGDFQGFMAIRNGITVGRVAAFINPRLREGDDPVGTVGYYEVVEEPVVSERLLEAAFEWLRRKGIRKVWGPMNFSIFHGYRFMTRGFERKIFFGEPYNKPYYPRFFLRMGFKPLATWHSWDLTHDQIRVLYESIRAKMEREKMGEMGIHVEPFDPSRFDEELERLYRIVTLTFGENIGYTNISFEEFRQVYGGFRHMVKKGLTVFLENEKKETIGFFIVLPDYSDVFRAMRGLSGFRATWSFLLAKRRIRTVCIHSIGIIKSERKKGIIYHKNLVAILGKCLRYERVIGALVRADGPNVYEPIAGPTREYCLYEKDL
jgi:GNAT superfamily N-acetyltransferase